MNNDARITIKKTSTGKLSVRVHKDASSGGYMNEFFGTFEELVAYLKTIIGEV